MNATEQLTAKLNYQADYATLEQTLWADVQSNEPMRLHCNEMPFDLPQHLKAQLTTKMADLTWNRYPDFHQTELTALLAKEAGVQPENIVIGNGSSQLIQQIVSCYSKFLSTAIIEHPTFTFYHQVCQNERMPYQEWALTADGTFDLG